MVFCSDGIVEASDARERMFGYERLEKTVCQACVEGLAPEALIDRLLDEVGGFVGEMPQRDDQTIVVLQAMER